MYSVLGNAALPALGFPIRRSAGQRLFSASPRLIAAVHVLRRLLVPRHPPCALSILTVSTRPPKRSGDVSLLRNFGYTCSFQAPSRPAGGGLPPFGLWKLSSARAPARPPRGAGAPGKPCPVDIRECLPRKEVIQPQLPLRLPCYDFTPITSPTFDGCLPEG
jgi:hypothetical protein